MRETESWPLIQAKYVGAKRVAPPRLIVIHTPIWPERATGAEELGRYFEKLPDGRTASVHIGVDSDSIVQYVKDSFIPAAAPGANHDGMHIEIIGTDAQSREQWRDRFSITALALAADAAAQWCYKFGIPPMKLTDEQMRMGNRGIVGHDQVSRVYKKSDHADPGPNFPWGRFIMYVKGAHADRA